MNIVPSGRHAVWTSMDTPRDVGIKDLILSFSNLELKHKNSLILSSSNLELKHKL